MTHLKKFTFFKFACLFIALLFLPTAALAQNSKPRLGLSVSALQAPPILLQHLRIAEGEGLLINNIAATSELDTAGLSQGDILLAIDGHNLSKPQDLPAYVANLPQNAQVTLDVIQKGEHKQIYVKLDNLPDEIVWKYAKPVSGPGRAFPGTHHSPSLQPFNFSTTVNPPQTGSVSAKSVYRSIVATENGIQSTSVSIAGPTDDPNTEIQIEIGSDTWKTTIADIDNLPEIPQKAARDAIRQNHAFSFSFGNDDDFMQEIFKRHQEQMQQMDEIMRKSLQNQQNTTPDAPKTDASAQSILPNIRS